MSKLIFAPAFLLVALLVSNCNSAGIRQKLPWISPSIIWEQFNFPKGPEPEDIESDQAPSTLSNFDIDKYNLESEHGVVHGSLSCECGLPAGRIAGEGKVKARINDIPWTAALVEKDGWPQPFCGAAIINDQFAATAAHCVKSRKPEELVIWLNDEDYLLSNETAGKRYEYGITEIIRHPEYRGYINDIALLKLNDTLKFGLKEFSLVNPVCIPADTSSDFTDETGTVAGWGRTTSGGEVSPALLKINVPILSNEVCIEKSKYKKAIRESMMCAGHLESGGADACQGDSGGPLIVTRKSGAILVGIVSWGFGCAEPFSPGVYSRVSHFSEWILDNTKGAGWCQHQKQTPASTY